MYGSIDHIKNAFEFIKRQKGIAKLITNAGDSEKYSELVKHRDLKSCSFNTIVL